MSSVLMLAAAPACAQSLSYGAYDWSGAYIGGHLGYAWADASTQGTAYYGFEIGNFGLSGASGGVQLGYNWQSGAIVFGFEVDASLSGAKGGGQVDISSVGESIEGLEGDLDWFGTARGRVGYALDDILFYGTGGLAWGGSEFQSFAIPSGVFAQGPEDSKMHLGWALGMGVEYGVSPNWTVRADYLYVALGRETYDLGPAFVGPRDIGIAMHQLGLGVNYRF